MKVKTIETKPDITFTVWSAFSAGLKPRGKFVLGEQAVIWYQEKTKKKHKISYNKLISFFEGL